MSKTDTWLAPFWMDKAERDMRRKWQAASKSLASLKNPDTNYGRSIALMVEYRRAVLDITEHFAHLAEKRTPAAPADSAGAE